MISERSHREHLENPPISPYYIIEFTVLSLLLPEQHHTFLEHCAKPAVGQSKASNAANLWCKPNPSNPTSSQSTSPCSAPAILLASQSNYILAANQPPHFPYQHIVVMNSKPKAKAKAKNIASSKVQTKTKSDRIASRPSSISASVKPCSEPDKDDDTPEMLLLWSIVSGEKTIEQAAIEAREAAAATQQTAEREAAAAVEAAKPEACAKDIGFFDPSMMVDLPWLHLSANCASFLQELGVQSAKYQESSVLKALEISLRGSALQWLKDQTKFTSLDDFKTAISQAFPPAPAADTSPDQVIINPPPRYHSCLQCDAQFSSMSRLLAHAQKDCTRAFTCKHCDEAFTSNNKLHEHLRHHSKIADKTLRHRFKEEGSNYNNWPVTSSFSPASPTSPTAPRSMSASITPPHLSNSMARAQLACHITPPASPPITSMDLATSATLATSAAPKASAAPKSSHHHGLNFMPDTPPPSPPQSLVIKHQDPHRKPYLTVNDLFGMFAGKPSRKSRSTIQKIPSSPCSPKSPAMPCLPTSSPKPMRQLNTAPLPPSSTSRSSTALSEPSHQQITMMKAPVACPPTPPPTPPRTPILPNTAPKACMTMDDLFAMFAGKRSEKSLDTIQKRIRSPMLRQAQNTSYHKPAGKPIPVSAKLPEKLKSSIFGSRPSSAPRACSPANRSGGTPQYHTIATNAVSSLVIQPKTEPYASPNLPRQEYIIDAGVNHTNIGIRVGTSLTNAGGYELVKASAKAPESPKSPNSGDLTSSPSSALRPCLPANSKPVTPQIADLLQALRALTKLADLPGLRVSAIPSQRYLAAAAAPIGT